MKPLKKLITDDFTTIGLLMVANYLRKKSVIVKITRNTNFEKINTIINLIRGLPNFVATFASFSCLESDLALQSLYEDSTGFCTQHGSDADNTKINLEVMKTYSHSLKKYTNRLDLNIVKLFLLQIVMAQLNAFDKCGFIHNDMHLGNILIDKKSNETKKVTYTINYTDYNYELPISLMPIISDFDKSVILDPTTVLLPKYEIKNLLYDNIIQTFNMFVDLLKDENDKIKMSNAIYNIGSFENGSYRSFEISSMNYLYNSIKIYGIDKIHNNHIGYKIYEEYKWQILNKQIVILNDLWYDIFGSLLFPNYASPEIANMAYQKRIKKLRNIK